MNCGTILPHNPTGDRIRFQIAAINELVTVLIPFLEKYPLYTSKYLNYQDFKVAVNLIVNKKHLTTEGLAQLRVIKERINKGRSFEAKWEFCKTHCNTASITADWICGFTDGEGCFGWYYNPESTPNKYPSYSFTVAQNTHDVAVLESINKFFNCGNVYPKKLMIL